MALWDQLKERAADMSAQAKTQAEKLENRDFAHARLR
jgi:tellurite resistance protein TerB